MSSIFFSHCSPFLFIRNDVTPPKFSKFGPFPTRVGMGRAHLNALMNLGLHRIN